MYRRDKAAITCPTTDVWTTGSGFSRITHLAIRFSRHAVIGLRIPDAIGFSICNPLCFLHASQVLPGINGSHRMQLAKLIGPTSMRRAIKTRWKTSAARIVRLRTSGILEKTTKGARISKARVSHVESRRTIGGKSLARPPSGNLN